MLLSLIFYPVLSIALFLFITRRLIEGFFIPIILIIISVGYSDVPLSSSRQTLSLQSLPTPFFTFSLPHPSFSLSITSLPFRHPLPQNPHFNFEPNFNYIFVRSFRKIIPLNLLLPSFHGCTEPDPKIMPNTKQTIDTAAAM